MLKNETPRGEMEAAEDAYEEQSSGVGSYEEYGDSEAFGENGFDGYEEEDENLADVAERILGARHSKVTTAAPIVTRPEAKSPAGERPKKTSAMTRHIPVRPRDEDLTRTRQLQAAERARRRDEEAKRKAEAEKKRKRAGMIAAALAAVLVIGAGIGTAVAIAKHRAEAAQAEASQAENAQTENDRVNDPASPDDTLAPVEGTDPAGESAQNDAQTSPDDPQNPQDDAQTPVNPDAQEDQPGSDASSADPTADPSADPVTDNPTDVQLNPPSPGHTEQSGEQTGEQTGSQTGSKTDWTAPDLPTYTIHIDFYDRDDLTVQTVATTLGALLANNGITLDAGERPSVDLWNDWLAADQTITVDRYVYVTEDVPQTVAHTTEEIGVDTMPRGQTTVLQEGVDGQSVMHYTVAYKNGAEFDRRLDWEEVVTAMVPARVQVGVGGTLVGKDGITYSYSYRMTCPATAYDTYEYTFSGNYVSTQTAAADFNYFALGTRMYVKNDRFDFGYRVVEEMGTNFDPWEIALWMPADDPNAPQMRAEGYVTDMDIYILD